MRLALEQVSEWVHLTTLHSRAYLRQLSLPQVETRDASVPRPVRRVSHGRVQDRPHRPKDIRRRPKRRLLQREVGLLRILRLGGEAHCCTSEDWEQDGRRRVLEDEPWESD